MNFQIGDKVLWAGCEGIVTKIASNELRYPLEVTFKEFDEMDFFTEDGKFCDWHIEPSLKLIYRDTSEVY
jgi:hypothetical protein